jgi:putative transposase
LPSISCRSTSAQSARQGITIEGIHYWSDVLRQWVEARDARLPGQKRRFIVRRDPRDVSAVWFWDIEIRRYQRIPYRDLSHPAASVWELREAGRRARQEQSGRVKEHDIFATYERLRDEENESARKTRSSRRNQSRRLRNEAATPSEAPLATFHATGPIVAFSEIEDL